MAKSTNGQAGTADADRTAMFRRAAIAHQNGRLEEAEPLYRGILKADPQHFDALHMLGILQCQRGHFPEGHDLLQRAVNSNPRVAEAHSNLGRALWSLGRPNDALASLDQALALNPKLAIALNNRGVWLRQLGRRDEALESYDRAIEVTPNNLDIMFNRGSLLLELQRPEDALAQFDAALGYHAGYVDGRIGRVNALIDLHRYDDAMAEIDRVLAADPKNAHALNNRGHLLELEGRDDEAIEAFNAAVAASPHYAAAYYNRGNLLMRKSVFRNAAADFATTLQIDGGTRYALGNFINCRLQTCDWPGIDEARTALIEDTRARRVPAVPFVMLCAAASPDDQLACARDYVADRYPPRAAPPPRAAGGSDRIRVAYVSGDLHEHAVAALTAGVFEQHDRSRFDVSAISFSPDRPSPMVDRLKAAFERFVAVNDKADAEIAAVMRELGIDIAVDLMGHTRDARTGIFARRAAPIQVNYLGYPGTMGADYIDYLIADTTVVPAEAQPYYAEKIVYLPDSFQANDSRRVRPAARQSRAEAGLPEQGIVFCAFNGPHKMSPQMFAIWLRLLQQVEGSVLWLPASNDAMVESLRREATSGGVDAQRLVFAPRTAYDDYLARYPLADIFLDTAPFNGGTTTSDALWAGVPVVTLAGETFAGRMSASLLRALGVAELVAGRADDYAALALRLATDPAFLAETRTKIARNRDTSPLFDTQRFTRHLEAAYAGMWERHLRGDAPETFAVAAIS